MSSRHANKLPPQVMSARGRKGALASPWSKGPVLKSRRALEEFAKRERTNPK